MWTGVYRTVWYDLSNFEQCYFPAEPGCRVFSFVLALPLILRLRVVPLSLSPSCVTRKKFARKKWPREILGPRSARKEGLPPKPKSLPFHGRVIFRCRISLDVLLLSPVINSPREIWIKLLYSTLQVARQKHMPWEVYLRSVFVQRNCQRSFKKKTTNEASCNDFRCV